MKVSRLVSAVLLGAALVLGKARQLPPKGSLVVSKHPANGQYGTVSAAVKALSTSTTHVQKIFVEPGTYTEQVVIPTLRGPLHVYGSTSNVAGWEGNSVTITYALSQKNGLNDDETGTVRVLTPEVSIYNINIVNSFGQGSQAIALSAEQDQFGCYGCSISGYQDTLLAQSGRQIYAASYIEGATDFIFGQHARALVYKSQLGVLPAGQGFVTANGRPNNADPSYYLITDSHIRAANGKKVAAGSYFLGRPWGAYARVTVQRTVLDDVINKAGFTSGGWSVAHAQFAEYGNRGSGAQGPRVSYDKQLSAPVDASTVLGSDFKTWVDVAYL